MDITQIINSLGFPIACVVGLALFVKQMFAQMEKTREIERINDKEDKEKLYNIIGETTAINKELLNTNKCLQEEVSAKIDLLLKKVDNVV